MKFKVLEKRWKSLGECINTGKNWEEAYNELVSLYKEPQRFYHNFVHIAHLLEEFDEIKNLVKNPKQVEIAIWYHDSVYNPKNKDNEEKSAELAQQRLSKAGIKLEFINNVVSLILATKHRAIPQGLDEKYLMDIDLSILGKTEKEFDKYEKAIRHEYFWVPEKQFRTERNKILQGFLERHSIYFTDYFRKKYEEQARKNLKRSIEQ